MTLQIELYRVQLPTADMFVYHIKIDGSFLSIRCGYKESCLECPMMHSDRPCGPIEAASGRLPPPCGPIEAASGRLPPPACSEYRNYITETIHVSCDIDHINNIKIDFGIRQCFYKAINDRIRKTDVKLPLHEVAIDLLEVIGSYK